MIYTKMMDSLNEEETPQEEKVVPQEQPAEIEEISVDDIESLNAYDKEHVELSAEITLKSMEFDKKFSMMSHVAKFGVDRSFLSICNSNNELATELGITLPATEDFEIYGDPNSDTSKKVISSMESFLGFGKKESLWSKFWKWIKEIVGKILGWIKGFFSKVWEFIKKLLGLGKAKLDKIEEVATQLKKAGIKTVDVNDDFARLGQDLQRSFIERQDRLIKSRQRVAFVKDIANTSLKIIKDLVKTRGEWVPARVNELEATTGKLKDWVSNTWGAVKGVGGAAVDTVSRTWDVLNDIARSSESSARRYAQKTVVAQRRREYINAARQKNDPLEDWMADTYTTQGKRGTHTRNTVFDNTDPWDYLHHGPQPAPQNNARQAQQNNANPAPQQRNQNTPNAPQARQQAAQGNNQPQQNSQPMRIEDFIRNHVADLRNYVVRNGDENGDRDQNDYLMNELRGILEELQALQRQVSGTTSEHAAIVQENISTLINAVQALLTVMHNHATDQGADLAELNRVVGNQLVNLVHGFRHEIGILGVVIFDSVNDSQNNFAVTSSEVRDVDYRRFIANGNNQTNVHIDETWVRPEGVGNVGLPNAWSVYLPADTNMNANVLSAVLTCSLPRRSIAEMWRGYGQSGVQRHASYWGEVRSPVVINVRFCIPLDTPGFYQTIDDAYGQNLTDVTYNFTSSVDPRTATSTVTHTHVITIGGNALQVLYTRIRDAIRRNRNNQALAQLYRNLTA